MHWRCHFHQEKPTRKKTLETCPTRNQQPHKCRNITAPCGIAPHGLAQDDFLALLVRLPGELDRSLVLVRLLAVLGLLRDVVGLLRAVLVLLRAVLVLLRAVLGLLRAMPVRLLVLERLLEVVALLSLVFDRLLLVLALFLGAFFPSLRASESPIAMACLRLVTFFPEPERRVPRFRSCIAASTLSLAPLLYFRPEVFFSAIVP